MKLIEALKLASAPQEGPDFHVLLACGFTPLHLETALKAHLHAALPKRTVQLRSGLYGDLAGNIERAPADLHAAVVALEWADLDARLGWRSAVRVGPDLSADVRTSLKRITEGINLLAQSCPVVLSLPAIPLPPVFISNSGELNNLEASVRAALLESVSSVAAVVVHPDELSKLPAHDLRSDLTNGFPFTFAYADALANHVVRRLAPVPPKKGLITDLDGTLWDGILGDDGLEGISWDLDHKTYFHALYQNLLALLSDSGVLVAVASKNDPELVTRAFSRTDLLAPASKLFPIEAHWKPKTMSVQRILKAWNISPDSIVFVDDNKLELEQIKAAYPDMECVEFRLNDAEFLSDLRDLFAKREVREEDLLRAESLRGGQSIRDAVSDASTLDRLLASAEAKLTIYEGKEPLDPRALELINKTNQFNLNGERYTEADWKQFLTRAESRLIVVDYQDRFGRLGKIAVIAGSQNHDSFQVDAWVMSCRAFSRRIEHQCLRYLLQNNDTLRLRFTPTERNGPLQSFLAEVTSNFEEVTRSEFQRRCPPLFHSMEIVDVSN